MLEIIRIVTGLLEENCYIIHNGKDALILDPGSDEDKITSKINELNLNVIGILITHYHFDHVGVLSEIKKDYPNAKVIDSKNDGDIKLGDFSFKIVKTFGHTMDSVTYYFDKQEILFTGDFVFKGSIGNFDLENSHAMASSLNVFKFMSKNAKVYPGHGEDTTVAEELKNNPYMKGL